MLRYTGARARTSDHALRLVDDGLAVLWVMARGCDAVLCVQLAARGTTKSSVMRVPDSPASDRCHQPRLGAWS